MKTISFICVLLLTFLTFESTASHADEPTDLKSHLLFLSTFDGTTTAQFSKGNPDLFTASKRGQVGKARPGLHDADVVLAKGQGRTGDAIEFKAKKRMLTFYKTAGNMAYSKTNFSGAVSFWLKVDPAKGLAPGYCDPVQITDSKYNDAAIWVDFTKDTPRRFRLGVVGDIASWNPEKSKKSQGVAKRTIVIKELPFSGDQWTHVLINFDGLNSGNARSQLFLNGDLVGDLKITDPFTWSIERSNIMLGLNYIGLMDELSIFDRPLSDAEVQKIANDDQGISRLLGLSSSKTEPLQEQ